MMHDIRITTVQTRLLWQDKEGNMNNFSSILDKTRDIGDIIILPEMFNTGFSMDASTLAERQDGDTFKWMKEIAKTKEAVICGSYMVVEDEKYYNRFVWVEPDGTYKAYNKRHLFRMAGEDNLFAGGEEKLIIEYKGWKVCPMVCYDLRFPVWSRNRFVNGSYEYDLLLYVANWPEPRSKAWKDLLYARAHENQCYVVGVNRVGKDGNDVDYSGDSLVISPKGETLFSAEANKEMVQSVLLSGNDLLELREKFPVYLDADKFSLE